MLGITRATDFYYELVSNYDKSDECKSFKQLDAVDKSKDSFEEAPLITHFFTSLGFYLLYIIGIINQIFFVPKVVTEKFRDGYVALFDSFEQFYMRYFYRRFRYWGHFPICSVPGDLVTFNDGITYDNGWTFEFTGTKSTCINLGSYNYLGFAQNSGPCADDSIESIEKFRIATCSSRREFGTNRLHNQLEALTAEFLGVEDAIVFGMGFATNALNLPSLLSPGCLVVSDEKNHASIILGVRLSGATTRVYKHNNIESLEKVMESTLR